MVKYKLTNLAVDILMGTAIHHSDYDVFLMPTWEGIPIRIYLRSSKHEDKTSYGGILMFTINYHDLKGVTPTGTLILVSTKVEQWLKENKDKSMHRQMG